MVGFGHPASAQSRDPYFSTFSANYDVVYHEPGATSNAGAHVDLASTFKRDVPFIGPVGEFGFNHFDGGTVASVMGGVRVRANTDYHVLPYVELILGLYHCGVCDINDFALQGGGGVDFRTASPNTNCLSRSPAVKRFSRISRHSGSHRFLLR